MKQVPYSHCTQPCSNCPYRTDAPVKLWHPDEFKTLLKSENNPMGRTYLCHKKNGSACIGWLMKQDENDFPSIMLRLALSKANITRKYLDKLNSPAPLYKTVKDMIRANFPALLRNNKK